MSRKSYLVAALTLALACAFPAFADATMYKGHHACPEGGKKGGCVHHYMGHHACKTGGKKGGCPHY